MLAHAPLSVCGFEPSGRNRIRGMEKKKKFVFQEIGQSVAEGKTTVSDNNTIYPCDRMN